MSWWRPIRVPKYCKLPDTGWFAYGVHERDDDNLPEQHFAVLWLPSYEVDFGDYRRKRLVWMQRGILYLGVDGFRMVRRACVD